MLIHVLQVALCDKGNIALMIMPVIRTNAALLPADGADCHTSKVLEVWETSIRQKSIVSHSMLLSTLPCGIPLCRAAGSADHYILQCCVPPCASCTVLHSDCLAAVI